MSIEGLPQELVDQICSHLHNAEDRYNVSFLSPKFEHAVTDKTAGRVLQYFESHKPVFQRHFRGLQHRSIKKVEFDIYTPGPRDPDEYHCSNVDIDERGERDKIFTAQIRDVFDTLSGMEKRAGVENAASYKLALNSPNSPHDEESRWNNFCCCVFHEKWHTRLLSPEKLPSLCSVRCLRIADLTNGSVGRIKFEYRILIDLLHRLPNLESLECAIGSDEWTKGYVENPAKLFPADYVGLRRDRRHGLLDAINAIELPRSLRRVNLDFIPYHQWGPGQEDLPHDAAQPNLISPALNDPFGTSLHILSLNLTDMILHAQVDSTLFQPDDTSTPTWPHLQRLFLKLHIVAPSGAWYFQGPKGEGQEARGYVLGKSAYPPEPYEPKGWGDERGCHPDSHYGSFTTVSCPQFRVCPNEDTLRPFLASFASAAANMPRLKYALLCSSLYWSPDDESEFEYEDDIEYLESFEGVAWGLRYSAPGEGLGIDGECPLDSNSDCRQIQWSVRDWRPDAELHAIFRDIGRRQHGRELVEDWVGDEDGVELDRLWEHARKSEAE